MRTLDLNQERNVMQIVFLLLISRVVSMSLSLSPWINRCHNSLGAYGSEHYKWTFLEWPLETICLRTDENKYYRPQFFESVQPKVEVLSVASMALKFGFGCPTTNEEQQQRGSCHASKSLVHLQKPYVHYLVIIWQRAPALYLWQHSIKIRRDVQSVLIYTRAHTRWVSIKKSTGVRCPLFFPLWK